MTTPLIDDDELGRVEDAVQQAFASGDESRLRVLGYGEISSVLAWKSAAGEVAIKRLPPFPDRERYDAYAEVVTDYLDALRAGGIEPVATELHARPGPRGGVVAYLVQPILDASTLAPAVVSAAEPDAALAVLARIVERVLEFVDAGHGLDAQLSNWALDGDRLLYLDVSTPMLRDPRGAERLDGRVFMASLPWLMRPVVRRLMLSGILAKYYQPRGVVLDLLGNLYKERLDRLLPALLELVDGRVSPAVTAREVERYYRGDARSWALLQRLRRLDRAWQRRVRRRPYPFLLPGRIER